MKDEITTRQTGCFCAISMLALKLVTLPSLLYEFAGTSGLIVALILFLFDFLALFLILRLKNKYKNMSLFEILHKYLGTFLAKSIYLIIFIFLIFKYLMIINEAVAYTQAIVDEDFTIIMFLMCFLPVTTAVAYSGLKSTARTCEFGFIFVIIGLVVCLFLAETTTGFMKLGSIFETKITKILSSSFSCSIWFIDFLFLLIIMDKIKVEKNMKKRIFNVVIFIFLILAVFYVIYFRLFRTTSFLHKNAIADVTQYNRNIGNVGNVDIISILVYLFVIFFQGAIYMSALKICFEKIVGYQNSTHALIFINILIICLEFFAFYNLQKIIDFYFNYFKYIYVFLWLIILWLTIAKKETKNVSKNKTNKKQLQ